MNTLILGGGLAGIAAAVRLSQAGHPVNLIETSRRLGGRATSHDDPETGQTIDNCQHVVMGCCTNLLNLYEHLGVSESIEWRSQLHFFDREGRIDTLESGNILPAPLHLSRSLLRMKILSFRERMAIARAMCSMLMLSAQSCAKLDAISFARWLNDHRQPDGAIEKFWSVVIVSALNRHPDRASAAAAIHVFQDGFLAHKDAYRMGTASVPLRKLYDPALNIIESAGGNVQLGASVRQILFDGQRVTGVQLSNGETHTAEIIISALPFDRLDKVTNDSMKQADFRLQSLNGFTHSPILGIHLWFEKPVVEHTHMIFVDSPLQWIFNKSELRTANDDHQYLHGVISAADEWIDKTQDEIVEMTMRELARYAPKAQKTKLIRARVIKEKRATFAIDPGLDTIRPATRGPIENLLLAGDWVQTGWPATMEGAVRSGYAAAEAIDPTIQLVPDLPRALLCRLLGH